MTPDEREKLIRRTNDELWNTGNVDFCDDVFAARCSIRPRRQGQWLKDQVRELRAAQPHLPLDVHDVLWPGT
jgi:hypothetical protein